MKRKETQDWTLNILTCIIRKDRYSWRQKMHENQSRKFMKRVHEKAIYIYTRHKENTSRLLYIYFFAARQKLKINIIPYTFFTHWKGKKKCNTSTQHKITRNTERREEEKEREGRKTKEEKEALYFVLISSLPHFFPPSFPPSPRRNTAPVIR